jgi:hypothetical protein
MKVEVLKKNIVSLYKKNEFATNKREIPRSFKTCSMSFREIMYSQLLKQNSLAVDMSTFFLWMSSLKLISPQKNVSGYVYK